MKTPEDILRQDKYSGLRNLVLICEAMEEYAEQFKSQIQFFEPFYFNAHGYGFSEYEFYGRKHNGEQLIESKEEIKEPDFKALAKEKLDLILRNWKLGEDGQFYALMALDQALRSGFRLGKEYASQFKYTNEWVSVRERLPEKPGKKSYEHVPALVYIPRLGIMLLMWNCEHLCWDMEDGDDVSPYNNDVTHWQILPSPPKGE